MHDAPLRLEYESKATPSVVVPYLEETYPAENDLLLSWIERQVGIRLSLASLCVDRTVPEYACFSGLTPGSALEYLLEDLADGTDPFERRLRLARNIHYGGKYAEARQILKLLIAEDPDDFKPLDLLTCILCDQEQYGAAQALARYLTRRFPERPRAWDRLATASQRLGDWRDVLAAVTKMLALPDLSRGDRGDALIMLARAHFRLGRPEHARRILERRPGDLPASVEERAASLLAEIVEAQAALSSPPPR